MQCREVFLSITIVVGKLSFEYLDTQSDRKNGSIAMKERYGMKAHYLMNFLLFFIGSSIVAGVVVAYRYAPPPDRAPAMVETAPIEITRTYEYDENNRLVAVKYSDGTEVRFHYDERGRMIERKLIKETDSDRKQVVLY